MKSYPSDTDDLCPINTKCASQQAAKINKKESVELLKNNGWQGKLKDIIMVNYNCLIRPLQLC